MGWNYTGSGVPVPDLAGTGDLTQVFDFVGRSFDGRIILKAETKAAALSTVVNKLTTEQRLGCIVWVKESASLWVYNGVTLVRFGGDLLAYTARGSGITQPTGLLAVDFAIPFAPNSTPTVVPVHEVTGIGDPCLVMRSYRASGFLNNKTWHLQALYSNTTQPLSGYIEFAYAASGPRPDGST